METAAYCPSCGRPRGPDDRFCAGCGRAFDHAVNALPAGPVTPVLLPRRDARQSAMRLGLLLAVLLAAGYLFATLAIRTGPAETTPTPTAARVGAIGSSQSPAVTGPSPIVTSQSPSGSSQGPSATFTSAPATPTERPIPRSTPGAALGETAPPGARPPPTATAGAIFFRREPYGPVKVEAGTIHPVALGRLEAGTLVRAVVTVSFNNRLSSLSGTPDIDVAVVGPAGQILALPQARSGALVSFQAPATGTYTIELGNARSRVNAKQVSLQFLQP